MRYVVGLATALFVLALSPLQANTYTLHFEDYPAEVVEVTKVAEPILVPGTWEYNFRTRIREAAAEGVVDFAGHYIIAWWGCGTECQSGAIIDALTGKVYELPTASGGWDYRLDSNLLIVDPDDHEDPPNWLIRQYYVWNGSELVLEYQESPRISGFD